MSNASCTRSIDQFGPRHTAANETHPTFSNRRDWPSHPHVKTLGRIAPSASYALGRDGYAGFRFEHE
ncbi:hypothetical protein BCR44DRAFT_43723 [Catenaria anguillulae PL171]|uniref:Uncharacterized protein n=1 Tax=Catenaria anguillulae PL171 TaxID=765915 RepID=A0A1Y2HUX0_9FUNG|nr:hypothetical protein BCR44DRAFT_43723 [Catenaria anguillulae PL171]